MNTFLIFAVIALALSGAWARPRHHRSHHSHRAHRQADCSHIDYRPFSPQEVVCGSDGKTYVNEEHIRFENCLSGEDVSVAKQGWCNEEIQTVEAVKNIAWELISSLLEEMFKDADSAAINEVLNLFFAISGEDVSSEDILNFLKENDSDENVSDAFGDFIKFLESLDNSSEDTDGGEVEEDNEIGDGTSVVNELPEPVYAEEDNEVISMIGDGTSVVNELPEPVYAEAVFNPEEDNEDNSFDPEEGSEESNLIPDILLD